jgi:hypothetical protein
MTEHLPATVIEKASFVLMSSEWLGAWRTADMRIGEFVVMWLKLTGTSGSTWRKR